MGIYAVLREIPDNVIKDYLDMQAKYTNLQRFDAPEIILDGQKRLYETAQQELEQELVDRGFTDSESTSSLLEKTVILYKSRQPRYQQRTISEQDWEPIENAYSRLDKERANMLDEDVPLDQVYSDEDISSYLSEEYGVPQDRIMIRINMWKGMFADFTRQVGYLSSHEEDEHVFEQINAASYRNVKIGEYAKKVRMQRGFSFEVYTALDMSRSDGILFESGLKPIEDLHEDFWDTLGEAIGSEAEFDEFKLEYHL